ncbi:rho guanine nucleotide exchange factor 15 isoform X2 [Clupea harengus]|uniref:Rho guanine nucleotide exchange factor 15 isoform X2 n=1 Tax=Clupea harengus TaxID=7950 RepID=A0A6P8FPS9_CLUHA|nr:rho guanine nucleotide exchange factor 15 isoform X2 [Clupea harengus]
MQSRKPPVPRKPVPPPKPNLQPPQAPCGPRPWPSTRGHHSNSSARQIPPHLILWRNQARGPASEDDTPPARSPLPHSPGLLSRDATEEFSTPSPSPRETGLTVTQGKEEKPELQWQKPRCRLAPEHGCRSDGSEKTDSDGVESEQPLSTPCSATEPRPNPCLCLCHQHRPGMKLVWVPVLDGADTGHGLPAEKTTEESMETTPEREERNEKSGKSGGEVDVDCVYEDWPDIEYECMVNVVKPLPPPRPAQIALRPAAQPFPDISPITNTKCKANSPTPPRGTGQGKKKESLSPNPCVESRPLPPIPDAIPQSYRQSSQPGLSYVLSPRGGPPPSRKKPVKSKEDTYEHFYSPINESTPEKSDVNLSDDYECVSADNTNIPVYIAIQGDSPPGLQPLQEGPKDLRRTHTAPPKSENPSSKQVNSLSKSQVSRANSVAAGLRNSQVSRANSVAAVDSTAQRRRRVEPAVPLWQERPEVKTSGVLDSLSHRQLLLQESMFEVLTSEESYLCSLLVLTDHFLGSRELNETLVIHDRKRLFSNIIQVYEVSERFLADLQERVDQSVVISDVCDIILLHAQNHFSVYTDYVRDQVYQEKTHSTLMQTNKSFAVVMRRLESSPLCKRLPFTSFLLLPFQRITRLKILIQNILKKTEEGSNEEQTSSQALAAVSKIIKDTNTQVGKMKQMEELISIANNLEFQKLKAVPIVSKTRYLEKQGELTELSKAGSYFNIRLRFLPVYVFLFNDLFILTNKKSQDRYVVIDHAHRSLVQVQAVGEAELRARFQHCLSLTLLENHQGQRCERLLKANTEADMHRWIAALPSLTDPPKSENEAIYQDWDCPQVQCVDQYTAQQADELSLEPGDIINVERKTGEGWCEGIRLSDGQKGWFPPTNVLEITNEHQRRRNLLEEFRILKLAANVAQSKQQQ